MVKHWFISLSLPSRQLVVSRIESTAGSKRVHGAKAGKGDEPCSQDIGVSPRASALCLRTTVLHTAWTFPMEFLFTGRKVVNCYSCLIHKINSVVLFFFFPNIFRPVIWVTVKMSNNRKKKEKNIFNNLITYVVSGGGIKYPSHFYYRI